MKPSSHLTDTSGYMLSKLGQAVTEQFAQRLRSIGIRPKHCGLLAAIRSMPMTSQLALGQALNLVPSAIVTMIDDLEALGAINRIADETDRRRYAIELTEKGAAMLQQATAIAQQVDDAILDSLGKTERDTLHQLLRKLATRSLQQG
ncbi:MULTISPECIES: MarR family winged helix-turn-helix transcriptional regulator [Paraburkholderia]|nr:MULTISPECIES: MarR family transcriptional regulator [Paraburkholderia]MCX4138644.1 winged helix DNA-binding protein [Paraburkholderia aspalathi]MDN7171334.1 winged helix DNA-binding protein [Paraburkholderia sp. SEWSISQ10-3 4]MDQ6500973.1 winged helix DNA-binding protein [Paraburkholderia aspalathi]